MSDVSARRIKERDKKKKYAQVCLNMSLLPLLFAIDLGDDLSIQFDLFFIDIMIFNFSLIFLRKYLYNFHY